MPNQFQSETANLAKHPGLYAVDESDDEEPLSSHATPLTTKGLAE